jgi:hypothetical protein
MQVSQANARELIRVGRALRDLPAIDKAFAEGALSLDAVRALTWFATAESDETLASDGGGRSIFARERAAARARKMSESKAIAELDANYLRYRWNAERSRLKGSFDLAAVGGGVVAKTLERLAEQIERDGRADAHDDEDDAGPAPSEGCLAEALVQLASTRSANDTDADRATLVVFTDERTLAGDPRPGRDRARRPAVARHGSPAGVRWPHRVRDPQRMGCHDRHRPRVPSRAALARPAGPASGWRTLHLPLLRTPALAQEPPHPRVGGRRADRSQQPDRLCFGHHVLVHEGGWRTMRRPDERWSSSARTAVRSSWARGRCASG